MTWLKPYFTNDRKHWISEHLDIIIKTCHFLLHVLVQFKRVTVLLCTVSNKIEIFSGAYVEFIVKFLCSFFLFLSLEWNTVHVNRALTWKFWSEIEVKWILKVTFQQIRLPVRHCEYGLSIIKRTHLPEKATE